MTSTGTKTTDENGEDGEDGARSLDTVGLAAFEAAFRAWAGQAAPGRASLSRRRMLAVFLLLRATGARLGEVLALNERRDVDCGTGAVRLGRRLIPLPPEICAELGELAALPGADGLAGRLLRLDQGQVRRTFAARAAEAGLPRSLASPTVLRRSRAVEMLGGGVPLSVVQKTLGQSSPSLTAAWHDYPEADAKRHVERFLAKERRRSSARNAFYGRITRIERGDVQALVTVEALGGQIVSAVITMGSLSALGLREGSMVTAEVKAPWVLVAPGPPGAAEGATAATAADNRFQGMVSGLTRGAVTTEVVVELPDGTAICAVVTTRSADSLGLRAGAPATVWCSAFSVILNIE